MKGKEKIKMGYPSSSNTPPQLSTKPLGYTNFSWAIVFWFCFMNSIALNIVSGKNSVSLSRKNENSL
jgi:hypothetical protein